MCALMCGEVNILAPSYIPWCHHQAGELLCEMNFNWKVFTQSGEERTATQLYLIESQRENYTPPLQKQIPDPPRFSYSLYKTNLSHLIQRVCIFRLCLGSWVVKLTRYGETKPVPQTFFHCRRSDMAEQRATGVINMINKSCTPLSFMCSCNLHVGSLLMHLNGTQPSLIVLITPVLFLSKCLLWLVLLVMLQVISNGHRNAFNTLLIKGHCKYRRVLTLQSAMIATIQCIFGVKCVAVRANYYVLRWTLASVHCYVLEKVFFFFFI